MAILVRDGWRCELLAKPVSGVDGSNLEIIWILIHVDKNISVLLGSAYRVPNASNRQCMTDFEYLENQLQHMLTNHPRSVIVLAGGFNSCLKDA